MKTDGGIILMNYLMENNKIVDTIITPLDEIKEIKWIIQKLKVDETLKKMKPKEEVRTYGILEKKYSHAYLITRTKGISKIALIIEE